jgi:hypothetical protein
MTAMQTVCPGCATPSRSAASYCRACGVRLPSAGDVVTGKRRWFARPAWRRSGGRMLLAVLLVVAIAVTATIYLRQRTDGAPDVPVRQWFAAVAARDTAAAARLRPGLDVLRNDFFHDPAYIPPSDAQIVRTAYAASNDPQQRPNHQLAYVTVRYQIAGVWFEHSVQVSRTGTGASRTWVLGDGATGSLTVIGGTLHTARVGPTTITTAASADAAVNAVSLPPGRYTVGPGDDPLFTAAPATVTVAGRVRGQPATTVNLSPTVKPTAVTAIDKLVRARVNECAARRTLSMVDCPFDRTGGPYTGGVTSVRWTIRRYPTIAVTPVASPYAGGPVATLSTTARGVARVAYVAYTTGGKTVTEDQPFVVDGDIRIENGSPIWTGGKSGRLI